MRRGGGEDGISASWFGSPVHPYGKDPLRCIEAERRMEWTPIKLHTRSVVGKQDDCRLINTLCVHATRAPRLPTRRADSLSRSRFQCQSDTPFQRAGQLGIPEDLDITRRASLDSRREATGIGQLLASSFASSRGCTARPKTWSGTRRGGNTWSSVTPAWPGEAPPLQDEEQAIVLRSILRCPIVGWAMMPKWSMIQQRSKRMAVWAGVAGAGAGRKPLVLRCQLALVKACAGATPKPGPLFHSSPA